MKEFLKQAKRASPSAYHSANKATDNAHGSNYIKPHKKLPVCKGHADPTKELLQRTEGTVCCGSRAGVTIKPWRTNYFQWPLINPSGNRKIPVTISQEEEQDLDPLADKFHALSYTYTGQTDLRCLLEHP